MHVAIRPDDSPAEKPMPHGLESQIRRVKNDARGEGKPLTNDEALKLLALSDLCQTKHRRDLALAEAKLIDLGYSDGECDTICAYIVQHGTVWGCEDLEESSRCEHAEVIEAVLVANRDELDMPPKRDEYVAIRRILEAGNHTPQFIANVVAVAKAHGTIEWDPHILAVLSPEVRTKIENAIPGVSPWQWDAKFGGVFPDTFIDRPIRDENGRRTYEGSKGFAGLAVRAGTGEFKDAV